MLRVNLGCGPDARNGWLNCDLRALPGVALRMDLRRGIPLASSTADAVVAIHVVQDLAWPDIAPAFSEIHRVLRKNGVLRLAVPDLDQALHAYLDNDRRYFCVPDEDAQSIAAKLVTQIIWYGSVRTPCSYGFLEEWLRRAGFADVRRRPFGESAVTGLASLDNRARESLFVEAVK